MRHMLLASVAIVLAAVSGCGGGEADVAEEGGSVLPVRAAKSDATPSRSTPAARSETKTPAAARPAAPVAGPIPDDQRENAFTLVTEVPPNFRVVAEGPDPRENQFQVVPPPAGAGSSSFRVQPPAGSGGGAASQSLPEGFTAIEGAGVSESGWPLRIRCEKDDAVLAFVPAGSGPLGTDDGPENTRPQLTIPLDAFYMDVHEVTLQQYRAYRAAVFEEKKRYRPQPLNVGADDSHPALGLSWGESRLYGRWCGRELPTEAEWERAARGVAGWRTPWGNGREVWSRSRTIRQIDPVQSFQTDVSEYGIYDLAGNAREWVEDWYSATAFADAAKRPASLPAWAGPRRASISNHRVVKGNGPDWSVWHRTSQHMSEEAADIGFRCVLRLTAPTDDAASADDRG